MIPKHYILIIISIFSAFIPFLRISAADINANAYTCPIKEPITVKKNDKEYNNKPFVDAGTNIFLGGEIKPWNNADEVTSPIFDEATGKRTIIGSIPRMTSKEAEEAVKYAEEAWNGGQGEWPQMTPQQRIDVLERVVKGLKEKRDEIVKTLMWEICKTASDATSEFDRTMKFVESTIAAFKKMDLDSMSKWSVVGGVFAKIRRAAIGIMLCIGPYNYPFNETYATLIPALLMGNVAIMKLPAVGGLAHMLTIETYAKELPKGVLQFISGSGRETIPPVMRTGKIDVLAFIGGSTTADNIIKEHPHPHRLRLFLQLEGKNLGIVTPSADLNIASEQIVVGSTSYNGQRCTAIKLIMVHRSIAKDFATKLADSISALPTGLPWESGVKITPLPEPRKPAYLESLIQDAVTQGAEVINAHLGGGEIQGALMKPAVVYPVTKSMRLWHEEQFGPVIPIAIYDTEEDIQQYIRIMPYGQQAAIFANDASDVSPFVDMLGTVVGRINLNTQCGRSPDSLPFSGRRSSAVGTMSVTETLKAFSIETLVASKEKKENLQILQDVEQKSNFLQALRGD